ncbi:hypothetical protein [Parasphingorhabdus sp.]|uniref:hypothetical protein n=1 Tax=Parasphingorhabdus sp. TaxID=2709688 RepID=UPI0032663103
MVNTSAISFTQSPVVKDDGTVMFDCSSDQNQRPWLALHPFDPIVVQTINYWVSVETSTARGTWDPTKWSALTQTKWTCGELGVGHATHGISEVAGQGDSPRFELTFFDDNGALVYKMSGVGVVFQTRDFESWREKAKQKLQKSAPVTDFQFAPADAVGVKKQAESFISPIIDRDVPSADVLITKESGFPPAHPYLSGSGDHVNSTHLADVARQFANLLLGGGPHLITGGEMTFDRYVELGRPFEIALVNENASEKSFSMAVRQAGRLCSTIEIAYLRECCA